MPNGRKPVTVQPLIACWRAETILSGLLRYDSEASSCFARWVQKPLACDFIAYAFAPSGVCYLLPVVPLQRAWRQHGKEWISRYGTPRAQNVGYVSVSVPVPKDVLMRAIADAMIVAGRP